MQRLSKLGDRSSPSGDESIPRQQIPQRLLRGLGDADSAGGANAFRAIPVVPRPQAARGGGQIATILSGACNAESLRQPPRSAAKFEQVLGTANLYSAGLSHFFHARDGL